MVDDHGKDVSSHLRSRWAWGLPIGENQSPKRDASGSPDNTGAVQVAQGQGLQAGSLAILLRRFGGKEVVLPTDCVTDTLRVSVTKSFSNFRYSRVQGCRCEYLEARNILI